MSYTIESIKAELIESVKEELVEIQTLIDNFKIDPWDYEGNYKDYLDSDGDVIVAGVSFAASRILEELNYEEYSEGLKEYAMRVNKEDDEDYARLVEERNYCINLIEELEAQQ